MLEVKVSRASNVNDYSDPKVNGAYSKERYIHELDKTIVEWFVEIDESDILDLVDKYGDIILRPLKDKITGKIIGGAY